MSERSIGWLGAGTALLLAAGLAGATPERAMPNGPEPEGDVPEGAAPVIRAIDPPERGFYAKLLDYDGIPIKAPAVVADRALFVARERLQRMLRHLPTARHNLRAAGAELHIIGKDQVTSDLPEHRHLKGKPFDGPLTVDQRTRGLGGLLVSCGEENLLELPTDRYRGRDICIHEFAHCLQAYGLSDEARRRIRKQYRRSTESGLWKGAYAGTNEGEFFAELTMWYFGTHGDLRMVGPKPEKGGEGLRKYDPAAYALLDALYSGRIPIQRVRVTELPRVAPGEGKALRPAARTQRTSIRFINQTGRELKLFWIDAEGRRQERETIPAGASHSRRSFAGDVWLVASADGEPLGFYVAAPEWGRVTLR